MPVLVLDVPRRKWNDVRMAALVFGLDLASTNGVVELSGPVEKLQQALNRAGNGVSMVGLFDRKL